MTKTPIRSVSPTQAGMIAGFVPTPPEAAEVVNYLRQQYFFVENRDLRADVEGALSEFFTQMDA